MDPVVTEAVKTKFAALAPLFDERLRRRWAAVEARSMGRGGIACLAAATGMSRTTIDTGLKELAANEAAGAHDDSGRLRRPGAGRKPLTAHDPNLVQALERLVDPVTRGDPMGPLLWTCSSAARLAEHLRSAGHPVSERTVNRLLHELGYRLQANRKTLEGAQHADRDAQFKHINRRGRAFQALRQPVVSVDTKKKELVGEYRNGGREWRPKGQPERVKVHDFVDKTLGKAIPYGIYDVTGDSGWVSVGEDHDTAVFAVETLRRWWLKMGSVAYPQARRLLITADGGGSNSSRSRLWKVELQKFADATGLRVSVCHFPPRHEQVEQDRASDVLPHYRELAWEAVGESGSGGEPDRAYENQERLEDPLGVGREQLPDRADGERRTDAGSESEAGSVSRRMELPTDSQRVTKNPLYFGDTS